MKKFDARYSKILLILLGVLVAIVIGFQSNAVGFDSDLQQFIPEEESTGQSTHLFNPTGKLKVKLLSFLK